jgi:crotonobetainyl-CoA:carnitine CoA-transferase CaiB-like acyl-CoA transferase
VTAPAGDPRPAGVRFLDDVRVLEIANLAPTQLAMHLADLGAEVIKIEPPKRGDATRLIAKRPGFNDSGLHRRWNRGKKSVALDTSTPEGVELLRRLIADVDIVVEGLRPGAFEKTGLSWTALTELNPDLVMVSLSGYGQGGPYRNLPSHGIGFDAVAGLSKVTHDESGRPRVAPSHVNLGTLLAPLLGSTAVLAALSWARRTGEAVYLDLAQADAAAFANAAIEDSVAVQRAVDSGHVEPPPAPGAKAARPSGAGSSMQTYQTRDGRVLLLMALERKFFVRLAEAVGRPDLLDGIPEDQYVVQGSAVIDSALTEIIAGRDLDEWMGIFAEADVPVVPVHESGQVASDPQLRTRIEWIDADQGTVTMKTPVKSSPPIGAPTPAQSIGEDTFEVLSGIGVDAADLARLEEEGVIGGPVPPPA